MVLGIPIALIGSKILKDNIKYTTMDLKIPKASSNLNSQYKQIDDYFYDILDYSGAKGNIKKIYDNKGGSYYVNNFKQGCYGGMERYLAEKGYYKEAIDYAKRKYDNIANKENRIKNQKRDERITIYERRLLSEKSEDVVITISFDKLFNKNFCDKPKVLVEKDVEKLIDYFHAHNNENVYCNIIMENDNFWHHKEVWHIKKPISKNAEKYYEDVYDKIINNEYHTSTTTTEELYELNKKQREINLSKHNREQRKINQSKLKYDNKYKYNNSTIKNESNKINNYKNKSNDSRTLNIDNTSITEMNSNFKHVVEEFKICPDINVVSKKTGIPASKIKKWYNKKGGEYKLFHDAIVELNPNMNIKTEPNINSLPISSQFNYIISSFKKYKNIKLVSEHTGVSENQMKIWFKLGKKGLSPYNYFYKEVSRFM